MKGSTVLPLVCLVTTGSMGPLVCPVVTAAAADRPSVCLSVQEERLVGRGTETAESVRCRLAVAQEELDYGQPPYSTPPYRPQPPLAHPTPPRPTAALSRVPHPSPTAPHPATPRLCPACILCHTPSPQPTAPHPTAPCNAPLLPGPAAQQCNALPYRQGLGQDLASFWFTWCDLSQQLLLEYLLKSQTP